MRGRDMEARPEEDDDEERAREAQRTSRRAAS